MSKTKRLRKLRKDTAKGRATVARTHYYQPHTFLGLRTKATKPPYKEECING